MLTNTAVAVVGAVAAINCGTPNNTASRCEAVLFYLVSPIYRGRPMQISVHKSRVVSLLAKCGII